MIFLDINTFYSPKAGGIRTYHQAKIAWFQQASEHEYVLVYPGSVYVESKCGPRVTLVEAYGPAATSDPAGYRILLDYFRVFVLIRRLKPDIIEAGDPWLTGLFCLALKKSGFFKGTLVSFYHSDPIPSYLMPWAQRGRFQPLKKWVTFWAGRAFYRLQNGYDLTIVSSKTMEMNLKRCGIESLAYLPFGVPALFLTPLAQSAPVEHLDALGPDSSVHLRQQKKIRILYAGRLDREKGIELILAILPSLLANEQVYVSVLGRGSFASQFTAFQHPRFSFLGFKDSQSEVREIYDQHDILLAPGPFETFGLGVLEAMARGLVVVGPDAGGTGELLRQAESPYIFKSHDLEEFKRAVFAAIKAEVDAEIDMAIHPAMDTGLAAVRLHEKNRARNKARHRSRDLAMQYGSWNEAVERMVTYFIPAPHASAAPQLKLLISLHDATPFHLSRLKKAEVFFQELGLEKVTYLLVPEYHGTHLSSANPEFIAWCQASRPFQIQWHLHGYFHLETVENSVKHPSQFMDGFKRRVMTGGEGEFLALNQDEMAAKLKAGREVFKACLGYEPEGFVAPAWLFNSGLSTALQAQGIRYTEDHGRLYDLVDNRITPSPVITWATRTWIRKYCSLVVCPILEKLCAETPVLRIAMHPFDFDHPETVRNMRGVLQRLLLQRAQVFCDGVGKAVNP